MFRTRIQVDTPTFHAAKPSIHSLLTNVANAAAVLSERLGVLVCRNSLKLERKARMPSSSNGLISLRGTRHSSMIAIAQGALEWRVQGLDSSTRLLHTPTSVTSFRSGDITCESVLPPYSCITPPCRLLRTISSTRKPWCAGLDHVLRRGQRDLDLRQASMIQVVFADHDRAGPGDHTS